MVQSALAGKSMTGVGRVVCLLVLAGCVAGLSGCTYLSNRGHDLEQCINTGVTVSSTPQFSLYIDLFSVFPVGYSNFDGMLYGYANERGGAFRARHESAGAVLWGREQFGWGERFNAEDVNSPSPWRVGVIGLSNGPVPPKQETVNSPKLLHLGWVGIAVYCRPNEMADFLLGWFGIDIMGDDKTGAEEAGEPAKAAEPAPPAAPAVPGAGEAPPK